MSESTQRMEIKEIRIWKKETYESDNPGRFVARIDIKSPRGNLEIPLASEIAEPLLQLLAPMIAKFAKQSTEQITQDIESQVLSLQAPAIETPAITESAP